MGKLLLVLTFQLSLLSADFLRVGMELSYPPFEMICNDGTPCGVSVDLVGALGRFLNREIVIENIPFVGLIPSLQNGTIDLVASSLTITEERKKAINFSEPYASIGLCLLLNIHSKFEDINRADVEGNVIVVKAGTSGEIYARKHLQNATVRVFDKEAMCVLEVVQGKADAFIYDALSVYANQKKNPATTKANLVPFYKESWAFGVKKNNAELLEKINLFILKFREEKGFDRLAEKYLSDQKKAFKEMGVPFVF